MIGFVWRAADGIRDRARRRLWEHDQAIGRHGEDLAHRFLQKAGVVVVARNFRRASGAGEVDIIGWDGESLVLFEVKTRTGSEYGPPDRAISSEKQWAMVRTAQEYTHRANIAWEKVRFDVVGVELQTPAKIVHFHDAFSATQISR